MTDEVRDELVPINRNSRSPSCSRRARDYPGATQRRRITFEYVMLKGINDSDADARELVRLLTPASTPR